MCGPGTTRVGSDMRRNNERPDYVREHGLRGATAKHSGSKDSERSGPHPFPCMRNHFGFRQSGLSRPRPEGAIARELEREHDQRADAEGQARSIAEGQERSAAGRDLTLEMLLPPTLAAAVGLVTRYLPVDGPSAAVPLLTACAGMVRLGMQVEGSAAARFRVPLNLFSCLVGRSGSKKSPVDRALIREPLAPILAAQAAADRLARENWQMECRGTKASDRPDPPQPQRLLASDFTGEALAGQLEQADRKSTRLNSSHRT